ncbi:MAG TPA: hypothetical protein VF696_02135 [Candidatus Paceibacterota bacterium]|jgi:hypothetical protein
MHFSRKNLLTLICAAVVLIGGFYYFFFFTDTDEDTVLSVGAPASEAEVSFIALVSKLGPIEFDTRILDDARFMNLTDIRTTIVDEPKGRTDPFGPLGR